MENILITGVSGGIGWAAAERLLSHGSSVIGVCRTIREPMREAAERYPGCISYYTQDLMNTAALPELVRRIVEEQGPIGGFLHCAGFDKMAPLGLVRAEDIENLWRIHALVPMMLIAAISKKKRHRPGASIVLITSQAAHEGAMGHTAYAAAKGALEGYLRPAAAELMEKGMRINALCLSPVQTEMASGWMDKLTGESRKKLLDSYPMGLGRPEDVSGILTFLLSEDSRFINGQILTADGGHAVRKV